MPTWAQAPELPGSERANESPRGGAGLCRGPATALRFLDLQELVPSQRNP